MPGGAFLVFPDIAGTGLSSEEFAIFALEEAGVALWGIRLSKLNSLFREFAETWNIPVACTFLAIDILPSDHPLAIGRIGIKGGRAGNFALQNADLVISL